jgi:hypothetical protein
MYQGFLCEAEDPPHRPERAQDAIWSRTMGRDGRWLASTMMSSARKNQRSGGGDLASPERDD